MSSYKEVSKLKAKEIYFNFLNAGKGMISDYLAQQCTIVCVDEIIEAIGHCSIVAGYPLDFYIEVKKQIKKL